MICVISLFINVHECIFLGTWYFKYEAAVLSSVQSIFPSDLNMAAAAAAADFQPSDLPSPPEGWKVKKDNKGDFFYITPFYSRTGQKHKISKRSHLDTLVKHGEVESAVADSLTFKKSLFEKRATLEGNLSLN